MNPTVKSAPTQPAETPSSPCTDPLWRIDESESIVIIRAKSHAESSPQPDDWRQRIKSYFETIPNLAALGPKRLTTEGKIHSMGEFLIHPKGFHHLGKDHPATFYRFPEEVDVIAAGLLAVNRSAYHRVGGIDQTLGDLALIDLCLKLRLEGGRSIAVPDIVIETTENDTPQPDSAEASAFHDHWGFDWRAPDLEDLSARYAGTGLLWNVRYWGSALPFEKYLDRPAVHWTNYVEVEHYRQRADRLVEMIAKLTPTGLAVDLGCGDGLFTHLLARRGVEVLGIDPEEAAINQAHKLTTACETSPGLSPRFELGNGSNLSLENESAQTIFMLDVIEHLPNPIRILNEAARVLKTGGHLFVTTPAAQYGASSDPVYHLTEYSPAELENQLNAVPHLKVISRGSIAGVYRDILLAARKN